MVKFYGEIGYGKQEEIRPGVWNDVITERVHQGEVTLPSVNQRGRDEINPNLTLGNSFSILLDGYIEHNLFAIRYVKWMGVLWSVSKVDLEYPRVTLMVREVYNGPTP